MQPRDVLSFQRLILPSAGSVAPGRDVGGTFLLCERRLLHQLLLLLSLDLASLAGCTVDMLVPSNLVRCSQDSLWLREVKNINIFSLSWALQSLGSQGVQQ